ncbi:MAG: DUF721 domain-containing protein [Alistipes sp.]|nr:DUF721 domain-containing protein [Alistipes sp.]
MKRTEYKPIGALLDEFWSSPDMARKLAEGSLPDVWRKVVGEVVAAQTRQVRFVQGTLYVHVTSSIIRSELMMQRLGLVQMINSRLGMALVSQLVVQ